MGTRPIITLLLIVILVACSPERSALNNGPILVQEVTLAPTTPAPTRVLSATPSPIVLSVSTLELTTPIYTSTVRSNFVLITPTLPPSKTPTATPSITPTRTVTPTTRPTEQSVSNGVIVVTLVPTLASGVVPIPTAIGGLAVPANCSTPWFFSSPQTTGCPMNPPLISAGAFAQFQYGSMIWVEKQDAIYVLYNTGTSPRWQVFNDAFVEGMTDTDPAFNNPPASTWQPRRGFGLLWRNQPALRDRLGWAVTEGEVPFTAQVQLGSDGAIFIGADTFGIYRLTPDSSDWQRF